MLVGESFIVRSLSSPENLARYYDALSTPTKLLYHIPHNLLRVSVRVSLSIIEEIDTGIVSSRHTLHRDLLPNLATIGHPCTKGELAQLETRAS
jgi:hypothetical protein